MEVLDTSPVASATQPSSPMWLLAMSKEVRVSWWLMTCAMARAPSLDKKLANSDRFASALSGLPLLAMRPWVVAAWQVEVAGTSATAVA